MNDYSHKTTTGFSWPLVFSRRDELREGMKRLWRRRWLIATITFLGTAASGVVTLTMTPKYTSTAQLLVDPRGARQFQTDAPVLPSLLVDRESIESEIQILGSRRLVGTLVDRLKLVEDPEFNPTLAAKPSGFRRFFAGYMASARDWLRSITRTTDGTAVGLDPASVTRANTVDGVAKSLSITREGQSRVLSISVTSRDPVRAAEMANTLAELYLLDHLDNRLEQKKRVTNWLETRLNELRTAAIASERTTQEYRREAGLFETRTETGSTERIDTQQLTQLSSELIRAQTDRMALEAKLREVEAARGPDGHEAVPEVLNSPVIASLRTQEVRVKQRNADLENEYGARHPRMVAARGELEEIRSNIGKEVAKTIEGLRNEVRRARAREAAVQSSLRELERKTADQNARQVNLNELVRENDANQRILQQFLEQTKELSAKQALDEPDARIIANAEPPTTPSFPKKTVLVALALLGSLSTAGGLALLLERIYSRFRTREDVEMVLGLPTLVAVPAVLPREFQSAKRRVSGKSARILSEAPMEFVEALNNLHVAMLSRGPGEIEGSTLFTSAFPGEGKSTLAAAFARTLARHEKRVVLIDCDVRKPEVASMFGIKPHPGVSEVLFGKATAEVVVQSDPGSSMHIISAGLALKQSGRALSQDNLLPLLEKLSSQYDAVILDAGPVLLAPDAALLSRYVTRTVLVVRWNATSQQDVHRCMKMLIEAKGNIAGVILNHVDVNKYAFDAYNAAGAYLRAYRKYYAR
jgi:capsular exopolysaccharide synthesis family protein